ncbi:MAG: hypothetical protein AB1465_01405 [Patescibacteria group bacterium]
MKNLAFVVFLSFVFLNCGDKASVNVNVIYYSDVDNGVNDIPIGNDVVDVATNNDVVVVKEVKIGQEDVFVEEGGFDNYIELNTDENETVEVKTEDNLVCVPNCENKECGDDGCGGSCGECSPNFVCYYGFCVLKYLVECNDLLCLFYDSNSKTVIASGYYYDFYQRAVFFSGKVGEPYPNIEVVSVIDNNNFVAYFPAPKDKVYKLFNLMSWDGWLLVDTVNNNPFLGSGLEYLCDAGACAILISERKDF